MEESQRHFSSSKFDMPIDVIRRSLALSCVYCILRKRQISRDTVVNPANHRQDQCSKSQRLNENPERVTRKREFPTFVKHAHCHDDRNRMHAAYDSPGNKLSKQVAAFAVIAPERGKQQNRYDQRDNADRRSAQNRVENSHRYGSRKNCSFPSQRHCGVEYHCTRHWDKDAKIAEKKFY